jgi:hypothetical protein
VRRRWVKTCATSCPCWWPCVSWSTPWRFPASLWTDFRLWEAGLRRDGSRACGYACPLCCWSGLCVQVMVLVDMARGVWIVRFQEQNIAHARKHNVRVLHSEQISKLKLFFLNPSFICKLYGYIQQMAWLERRVEERSVVLRRYWVQSLVCLVGIRLTS